MSGEKTEKPTERRRKESRKEGQVPRTQELGGWSSMLVVGVAAPMLLSHELDALRELMVTCLTLGDAATPATAARGAPRLPSAKNCRITTTNPSTGKPSSGSTHGSVDTSDDTTGRVRRHASGVVVPST